MKRQTSLIHSSKYKGNFNDWKWGSINIRSGKEKSGGAKMYAVAKEIDRLGITICCLQEVRYRNNDKRTISLPSGAEYDFKWSGPKRRRDNGVGFLVKVDRNIVAAEPDTQDPRIIAMKINVYGFKIRLVNAYSPTNTDGSSSQKDDFCRKVRKACISTMQSFAISSRRFQCNNICSSKKFIFQQYIYHRGLSM